MITADNSGKLTKRAVDAAKARPVRYTLFDADVRGLGLRVSPSGSKTWIFEYKPAPGGRGTPTKRVKIGDAASLTAELARNEAKRLRALVSLGGDPQGDKFRDRTAITVKELAEMFVTKHVAPKRKAGTLTFYRDVLDRTVVPRLGSTRARCLERAQVSKLHHQLRATPYQANRTLAVISSMYRFASVEGLVDEGYNPARGVEKYPEAKRGDVLRSDQLERLGAALREAETTGIPWVLDPDRDHTRLRVADRVTRVLPHPVAAIRLLLFTGCRLREILHLEWSNVDLDGGRITLPDHKTSRTAGPKVLVLNAAAIEILKGLERLGRYVIAGETAGQPKEKPRADLKKPWALVSRRAGLMDVRLHDLRHNFGSFGAGGGLGLPTIGKLLGHTNPQTTQRYAHLDADPLRRASNAIASAIAASMIGKQ